MPSNAPAPSGHLFEFEGVEYLLKPVTQDDQRELHAIANAHALAMMKETAKYQNEVEAFEEATETRRLVSSGYFAWDEPGGWTYRNSRQGLMRICWLCLRRVERKNKGDDGKVKLEVVQKMAEVDYGRWLREQYDAANFTPAAVSPPTDANENESTPDLPNSGDAPGLKLAQ